MSPHRVTEYGSHIYWNHTLGIPPTEYGTQFREYNVPQDATMKWPREEPQEVIVLAKFQPFGPVRALVYLVLAGSHLSGIHAKWLKIRWNDTRYAEPENKKTNE